MSLHLLIGMGAIIRKSSFYIKVLNSFEISAIIYDQEKRSKKQQQKQKTIHYEFN